MLRDRQACDTVTAADRVRVLAEVRSQSVDMDTLAFGLFPDRVAAGAAIERLQRRRSEHIVTIHEHFGDLPTEDVQVTGTQAWLYALLGGLFAGIVGGTIAAIMFGDRFGVGPVGTGLIAGVAAAWLGILAGIAGTAMPRRELERLRQDVEDGRTLVTVNVDSKRASVPLQLSLQRSGALRTGILYGPGLGSTKGPATRRFKP
jgi:hypothetical protein